MSASEIHRCWEWPLLSSPAAIWPLISNTDRFNQDSGVPAVERIESQNGGQALRISRFGVTIEWDERPFEWVRPERFGVVRTFRNGPYRELRVLAELIQSPRNMLRYQVWAKPRNLVARALVALQLTDSGRRFGKTVREYDQAAATSLASMQMPDQVTALKPGGKELIDRCCRELLAAGCDEEATALLCGLVERAGDRDASRMRPYLQAEMWKKPRRQMVELFLHAAQAGLLELQWDLLCPSCRGAKLSASSLAECDSRVHCEACGIDYTADFAKSVELTFRPSPDIRELHASEYCIGGPQNTPHIVMQQVLDAGEERTVRIPLEPGAYRYRQWGKPGTGCRLDVLPQGGARGATLHADGSATVATYPELRLRNPNNATGVMVLERTAWSDMAATAAEVTSLPLFRELFPDHHRFSNGEIARLAERTASGVWAVCTLKDAVKLAERWPRQAPPLWYVSQLVTVERGVGGLERVLDDLVRVQPRTTPTAG